MLYAVIVIGSWLMTTCGIFVFLTLSNTGKPAEYGRYSNPSPSKWMISAKLAWMTQESPAFFIPFYFYWTDQHLTEYGKFLTCVFLFYYAYRTHAAFLGIPKKNFFRDLKFSEFSRPVGQKKKKKRSHTTNFSRAIG
ncbi:hypothetical protein B9Z55_002167 [Caenorhabditis nigoni]|uniref:Steroid 5-alpha reductase C-terminal domain-containing protein n=1 Tax=Caenorhabditis nigoni TaxID=1611254 RepID=A0A2G5VJG3_9PELO|nr:hypothetical protein B9Z55_002167 [Caenorhabditis nigoni]